MIQDIPAPAMSMIGAKQAITLQKTKEQRITGVEVITLFELAIRLSTRDMLFRANSVGAIFRLSGSLGTLINLYDFCLCVLPSLI